MKKSILFLLLLFASGGCAMTPEFVVGVNSINSGSIVKDKQYIILSGMKDVKVNDLQFKEYVTYIKRAFASRSLTIVEKPQDANVAVFIAYGISDPKEQSYIYSIPILGQTGYSSAQTFGSVNSFGNTATYSGTTTYTPSYGIVGSTTHHDSFVTYNRHLIMDAYDLEAFKQTQEETELWKTEVTSVGTSSDLRRVFPVLLAAATPYIGEDTKQKLIVELKEDDQRVLGIKGISRK